MKAKTREDLPSSPAGNTVDPLTALTSGWCAGVFTVGTAPEGTVVELDGTDNLSYVPEFFDLPRLVAVSWVPVPGSGALDVRVARLIEPEGCFAVRFTWKGCVRFVLHTRLPRGVPEEVREALLGTAAAHRTPAGEPVLAAGHARGDGP